MLAQAPESSRPRRIEHREPVPDLIQPLGVQLIVILSTHPLVSDEADVKHDPKMLGHGRPGDGQSGREVPHGFGARRQLRNDLPANRVSDDAEGVVDGRCASGRHLATIRKLILTLQGRF